jgi:hypothetical protein
MNPRPRGVQEESSVNMRAQCGPASELGAQILIAIHADFHDPKTWNAKKACAVHSDNADLAMGLHRLLR